ncbi:Gfo/Idh/MocA family protein [Pedobacter ureilyticus]|uniref:Gfo/Idh/MocA family protein n=1 Tax=Pedobacter ureilyticus TaxID=1393051 RepID=A0ABW9J843_9SPHI|nr:Gfo/Idh/MocA family oxidoreductase [Pedobacter helvus]
MKRRNFLHTSGILASSLLLQSEMAKAFKLANNKLRIGIIGCGDRGTGLMRTLHSLPDLFQVTAICDVLDFRLEHAQKIANDKAVESYTNYQQLLKSKKVDAVIIAVTLSEHFKVAKAALQNNKHIYLEKAMTYNIPQALELVELKKKHPHQILQVGHQYRYTPLYFKVKEMIQKGYLGKVTQIDCRWDRNSTWRRPVPSPDLERQVNWRMYREYSGGLAAELLSHQIDFINWAFDTHPTQIMATGGIDNYKDGRETFDNIQVMFRYEKEGMVGNFGSTLSNEHDSYLFKIKGTKGMVSMLFNDGIFFPEKKAVKELQTVDGVTGATKIEWNKEGGIPIIAEKDKDGSWYALKDFHNCIAKKLEPTSNILTGATTAFCVHLANEAMYNNKIQHWKDYPELNSIYG